MNTYTTPVALIILDGFGLARPSRGNAISLAHTPHIDELFEHHPFVRMRASEEAVGLPKGQMGNSEVGHLNIGAGRVVYQELTRINRAISDRSFFENGALNQAFARLQTSGGALHILGLTSDGGVHSSLEHIEALIEAAVRAQVKRVYLHCFTDGRDVAPRSGVGFIQRLSELCRTQSQGTTEVRIASISGRYFAMDRDKRWDRVARAYHALRGDGEIFSGSPVEAVEASYAADVTDEFIEPVSFVADALQDGDEVVFANFRPDRARQLSHALIDEHFEGFDRDEVQVHPQVHLTTMTEYDETLSAAHVMFPKEFPEHVLAQVLSEAGLRQLHIAETEKYAHVTFFINGGVEEPFEGEKRILVPSPKVATYDLQPEMSAPAVADAIVSSLEAADADVYLINFANCDMVGHTGVIDAARAAVEAVDTALGRVLDAISMRGGVAFVTADHGNVDRLIASDGTPFTAHTTNLVPFVLFDPTHRLQKTLAHAIDPHGARVIEEEYEEPVMGDAHLIEATHVPDNSRECALCDIAPTILDALGINQPHEMTGISLLA